VMRFLAVMLLPGCSSCKPEQFHIAAGIQVICQRCCSSSQQCRPGVSQLGGAVHQGRQLSRTHQWDTWFTSCSALLLLLLLLWHDKR
jgi:hypothetical protein